MCARFGGCKGMVIGIFSWFMSGLLLSAYGQAVQWSLVLNFFFDAVLSAALIMLMVFWKRWPYTAYKFRHSFSDTLAFASVSTAIYFVLDKISRF